MNSQFQFTVSRFTFQMQTPESEVRSSPAPPENVLSRQRVSLDKFPEQTLPPARAHPTSLPILPIKMHSVQCRVLYPYLRALFPLPNSSLTPSFNQQPCFDFHLRLFVAHCTFGSFQWHFNVPTRTAAAPFHQGLLTAVLASSPPSFTKLPSLPHPLGFFAYFAPFAGRHCQNS